MIDDVDRTVENLLLAEFGSPLPFDLSFALPDKAFTPLSGTKNTLNCYLYEIREDRELRDPVPMIRPRPGGRVEKEYPPARIHVCYRITAWSPATVTPGVHPTLDEHALLGDVLKALLRHPIVPPTVLAGKLKSQDPPLPTSVVLPDSAKAGWDFWNAVGGSLRPSLDYGITFSIPANDPIDGPAVSLLRFMDGVPLFIIGGTVRDSQAEPEPVADAWVRLEETQRLYTTDSQGRFLIQGLRPGNYKLTVRATGFNEAVLPIAVPLQGGAYDVQLTPL